MVRKIVPTHDPNLRQPAKRVVKIDKKILQILKDMEDTLKSQKDPEGVGLAALQIGEPYQIFLISDGKKAIPVFNPEIIKLSRKTNDPSASLLQAETKGSLQAQEKSGKNKDEYIMEGCLSLPHYYGPVQRAWEVTLKYDKPVKLEAGGWRLETRSDTFKGFVAQIIQHEVDHLKGKIFIDRLLEQNRKLYLQRNKKWTEVELP